MFVCDECSGFAADLLGRAFFFIPSFTHRAWIFFFFPSSSFFSLPTAPLLTNLDKPHSSACVLSSLLQLSMMSCERERESRVKRVERLE